MKIRTFFLLNALFGPSSEKRDTKGEKSIKRRAKHFFKTFLCKFLWYIFIFQAFIIIYHIAPKPSAPLITISSDFAKIYGPNIIEEGQRSTEYMVKVTKDLRQDLNVTLQYSGTAKEGVDYVAKKHIIIKEGELYTTFTIDTIDDALADNGEVFAMKLKSITGISFMKAFDISDEAGVVFTQIVDEKNPKYEDNDSQHIDITGAKVVRENNNSYTYSIALSQAALEDIDFTLSYGGDAVYGVEYHAPKKVSLKKGETSVNFKIDTVDNLVRTDKRIDINIVGLDDIGYEDIRYKSSHLHVNLEDEQNVSTSIVLHLDAPKSVLENGIVRYVLHSDMPVLEDVEVLFYVSFKDKGTYPKVLRTTLKKDTNHTEFTLQINDDNSIENEQFVSLQLDKIIYSQYEKIVLVEKRVKTDIVDAIVDASLANVLTLKAMGESNKTEADGSFKFTIISQQVAQEDISLALAYTGSATQGKDFIGIDNVSIAKGIQETTVTLNITDDDFIENDEDIIVSLIEAKEGGLEAYTLGKPLVLTIRDEQYTLKADEQTLFVSLQGQKDVKENQKTIACKILFSKQALADTAVELNVTGTATEGVDYEMKKTFTVAKGEKEMMFNVLLLNDNIKEGTETIILEIASIEKSHFEDVRKKDMPLTLNIVDEQTEKEKQGVTLSLSAVKTVKEAETLVYGLKLSQPALEDMQLHFSFHANDTQSYDENIELTFSKGESESTFSVEIGDDNIIEKESSVTLKLEDVTDGGYEKVIKANTVLVTNIEDVDIADAQAIISIEKSDKKNITEDVKVVQFTVYISQPVEKDLDVYLGYGGSATQGKDFVGVKKVRIAKGTQKSYFELAMVDDNFKEINESIIINITKTSNGGLEQIVKAPALHVELKDEAKAENHQSAYLSLSGPSDMLEEKSGLYVLELTQTAVEDLLVHFSYDNSTATADKDFSAVKTVTLAKGTKRKTFTIEALDDADLENSETLVVKLESTQNGGLESIIIVEEKSIVTTHIADDIDIQQAFNDIVEKKKIMFVAARDFILEESYTALDAIVVILKKFTHVKLTIEGHSNNLGKSSYNYYLSERRARSVKQYLVDKGIGNSRLKAVGFGDKKPLLNYSNPEALERNKRVDFKVRY